MSVHQDTRMYESKYPEVDDVVMVQVKSIAEMGAYVSLLEYNGIEGMILLSELSRRRIRSITKLIKVILPALNTLTHAALESCATSSFRSLRLVGKSLSWYSELTRRRGILTSPSDV